MERRPFRSDGRRWKQSDFDGPPDSSLQQIKRVEVLTLRRNVGHQRAIALGLSRIHAETPCDAIVVMDSDGEDSPDYIGDLLAAWRRNDPHTVVFAARASRSEGPVFRIGYAAYKWLFRTLTGRGIDVGNFSIVPFEALRRLVGVSELWNHYAAAVFRARIPLVKVPVPRAKRLAGQSRMNFVSLVGHGMSAISVQGEVVGVRLLCVTALAVFLSGLALVGVVGIRLLTDWAIPGWATYAAGLLGLTCLNLIALTMLVCLFILHSRSMLGFVPIRDWRHFILESRVAYGQR